MRSEFEFIRNIKKKHGLKRVGDDCAVLPKDSNKDLVVTADMLVGDIDFRLEWTTPEMLGHKALAVSLSDVAAMGGSAKWAMLSIAVPVPLWRGKFIDRFYKGWMQLARKARVELVGGDVSRSHGRLVVDSIVIGEVGKGRAVLRSGASAGDSIFVTGTLGGAAAGLKLLRSGERHAKASGKIKRLISRQLRPEPRIAVGQHLGRRQIATAMIDISDGLASDLHHICEASRVGARIDLERVPFDGDLADWTDRQTLALSGGEDFELLFTSAREKLSGVQVQPVTRIGEITGKRGVVELITAKGVAELPPTGYRHF